MECEVCKSVFPTSVSIGEEEFDLLNVATPAGPHIVLEDLRTAGQVAKGVHVVGMSDEQRCRFGRAQACEVVLSDVSVARFHASIRLSKGAYYLEDLESKFGTAVLLRKQLILQAGGTVTMQSDAVVVTIRLVKPFRFRRYLCCFYSRDREVETRDQVRVEGNGCGLPLADMETDKVVLGDPGTTLRSDHA
jgi:pSer/pThr/pTyr-binding forkhead associated (FHA) protein